MNEEAVQQELAGFLDRLAGQGVPPVALIEGFLLAFGSLIEKTLTPGQMVALFDNMARVARNQVANES